jgi:tetratricopeptide (TPR) repeat protein
MGGEGRVRGPSRLHNVPLLLRSSIRISGARIRTQIFLPGAKMGQIKFIKIIDDKSMPGGSLTILKPGIPAKPVENSRVRPKPEGALDKLHSLFRKEKWRDQKDFEYYQDLVRKEPRNTFARLRLAEIYQKRGEKTKAILEYFQTAEIFSRKRLYPQAVAIYKRIQKQDPTLFQLYPKFAEICRKMGFPEDASSQPPQGMKESAQKGMGPMVDSKSQDTIGDKQEKKLQSFQEVPKAKEEKGGRGASTQTPEVAFSAQEKKDILFDLGE